MRYFSIEELNKHKLSLDNYDYKLFLLENYIKLRKDQIKKNNNKFVFFDDDYNLLIVSNKEDSKLKLIEDINKKIYLGNLIDKEEPFFNALEEFLLGESIILKGLLEYLLRLDKKLFIFQEIIEKMLKVTPTIYYNSHYKLIISYSSFDNFFREERIINDNLKLDLLLDQKDNDYKEKFVKFMEFFGSKYFIRKGRRYFIKNVVFNNKDYFKIISLSDKNLLIDTNFKFI